MLMVGGEGFEFAAVPEPLLYAALAGLAVVAWKILQ